MGTIQQFTVAEGTTIPFSVAGDREVRITSFDSAGAQAFGEINMESAPLNSGFYLQAWDPNRDLPQTIITLNHGMGARYTFTAIAGDQLFMVWED